MESIRRNPLAKWQNHPDQPRNDRYMVPLCSTMTPSSLPLEPLAAIAFDRTPEDRGGPRSGRRVLDCSIAMAGPLAAMRLGDLGADVIKIEPVTGEWHRHVAGGGA